MGIKMIGIGTYLPKKIVSNEDLSRVLDTSDEWIKTRTGIGQRRIANPNLGESCSFMAYEACKQALNEASLNPTDIDMIVMATVTADYRVPSAAVLVQSLLGTKNIPAFDIQAACAGSIYGLNIAHNFISSGQCKKVLFVASELMSSIVDQNDRNTAILFGDGASAALLSRTDEQGGFIDFELFADGNFQKTIFLPCGGSRDPLDHEKTVAHKDKISMNGRETYKFAVTSMCEAINKILKKNNLVISDVNFVVPHQANLRIIESIAERMNIPIAKFLINLDRYANTSAASLLLAYDEGLRTKQIKSGDLILFLAIGAGFAWGASLYRQ